MQTILSLAILLSLNPVFGQTSNKTNCKIEFYLLKSIEPNLNTTSQRVSDRFSVEKKNLADTAFISNQEIMGYTFRSDTLRFMDSIFITNKLRLTVNPNATNRIKNLNKYFLRCTQFALVVNDSTVYPGYFWDVYFEWSCGGIKAVPYDTTIDIYGPFTEDNFCKRQ